MRKYYTTFSRKVSIFLGTHKAFLIILFSLVIWLISGFLLHFSHLWENILVLSGESLTLLLLALLQYKENIDIKAINIKLDELIRVVKDARIELVQLEEEPEADLDEISDKLKARKKAKK